MVNLTEQFITEGPLFERMCTSPVDLKEWMRLGAAVAGVLRLDHSALTEGQAARIYRYYLPVYFWVRRQITEVAGAQSSRRAVVVGLSCPQGGGKTTLLTAVQRLLTNEGLVAVQLSIDDLYLTNTEQRAVSGRHKDNPLLQGRGNPGTHDTALGAATLQQLVHCQPGQEVAVPRYDKSAFDGKGDRFPQEAWTVVTGPVDAVLVEGWCLGFRPVEPEELCTEHLKLVNDFLREQFTAWCSFLDAFIGIEVGDYKWVFDWRKEAEHAMLAEGRGGMSDEEVVRFCDRYMPSYQQYLPGLYASEVVPGRQVTLRIDKDRRPVSVK